ncbi:MAG: hypothetical protein EOP63_17030 [Sphingomonadales bacterium]|nr:MAG: hypothetical protein EOP63_17030 [Sphingomonadales bacterium]
MAIRRLAPNFRASAPDSTQTRDREPRREFAELESRFGVAQARGSAQPATVTLQIIRRETVHRHMLGRIRVAASPRLSIPIGGRCGMISAHLFGREIACEQHLPMIIIPDGQSAKDWLAKTGPKPCLNVQGTVVQTVEFVLIAKHRCGMHLAFDKGKSTS